MISKKIAGYTAITDGPDPNYKKFDGKWNNDLDPYVAIHRVAIYDEYRGMHIYDDSVNVLTNFSVFQHKLKSWLILRLSHQHNLIQAAINAAKIAPI